MESDSVDRILFDVANTLKNMAYEHEAKKVYDFEGEQADGQYITVNVEKES